MDSVKLNDYLLFLSHCSRRQLTEATLTIDLKLCVSCGRSRSLVRARIRFVLGSLTLDLRMLVLRQSFVSNDLSARERNQPYPHRQETRLKLLELLCIERGDVSLLEWSGWFGRWSAWDDEHGLEGFCDEVSLVVRQLNMKIFCLPMER